MVGVPQRARLANSDAREYSDFRWLAGSVSVGGRGQERTESDFLSSGCCCPRVKKSRRDWTVPCLISNLSSGWYFVVFSPELWVAVVAVVS